MALEAKKTDDQGRVTFGPRFANRVVKVVDTDDSALARIVPENEAWLYESPEALESVLEGIDDAKNRRFAEPPDLAADCDE